MRYSSTAVEFPKEGYKTEKSTAIRKYVMLSNQVEERCLQLLQIARGHLFKVLLYDIRGKCAPPTRPPASSPSALFGRKAPYEGGRARGRPPPRPRGARLPCNTVHTVQPIRANLITLRYHGETAHPPPAPRPPFSVRPRSL